VPQKCHRSRATFDEIAKSLGRIIELLCRQHQLGRFESQSEWRVRPRLGQRKLVLDPCVEVLAESTVPIAASFVTSAFMPARG
jgi:hypothetical protein